MAVQCDALRYAERESPAAFDSTTALTYAALHVPVVIASRRARARVGSRAGARRLRDVRARRRPLVGVWRRRARGRGADARPASSRAVLGVHLLLRRGRTWRVDRLVDTRRGRRRRDLCAAATAGAPDAFTEAPTAEPPASSCPFAAMLSEGARAVPAAVTWSPEAEVRIARIPDFIRPMARRAIEHYAEAKGLATITEGVMDEARGAFGM